MKLNNYEGASWSYLINQPLSGGTCMHAPYPKEFSTKGLVLALVVKLLKESIILNIYIITDIL